ncbi:MAG: hypothetical protein IJE68_06220 [Clostridia bacterium]|nr:hypothetical protein [Clostridia bacterium]
MNQILVTGDEQVTVKVTEKVQKQKKVLPINGIILFFAISIIILGICIIAGSIYSKQKINETVEASIQPEVQIERDDENNTIEITATHIRGITTLTYQWNDEEEMVIKGNNEKRVSTVIDLIGGENTLKVSITEENGKTKSLEKTFVAGNIPEITLEAVANGVKVIATNEDEIEYIQYRWDEEEPQKVEVGEKQYEGIINAPRGEHLLKIEVVSVMGVKAIKEQKVVGDTEPTLNIQSKLVNGKATFVIDAEDDEKIETLTIVHNGGESQVIEVNEATYHYEVIMTEGEQNTILVTVTNINGLQKIKGVRFTNK